MPLYSGTAEAGSTVTLIVDGLPVGNATADAAGEWSFRPTTALVEGAHTVRANATDAAGNTGSTSATRGFTVYIVDTVPPGAPELILPEVFNTQRPIIAGRAEPLGTITIWLDGTEIGTTVTPETGLWAFTLDKDLAEGEHLIKANSTDAAGNVSADSKEHSFKIVILQRSHYGWNCATAPGFPATWALLTLALALRGRRFRCPSPEEGMRSILQHLGLPTDCPRTTARIFSSTVGGDRCHRPASLQPSRNSVNSLVVSSTEAASASTQGRANLPRNRRLVSSTSPVPSK